MSSFHCRRLVHVVRRSYQNRTNGPLGEIDVIPNRISNRKCSGHIKFLRITAQEKSRSVKNEKSLPLWGVTFSSAIAVLISGTLANSFTDTSSSCQSIPENDGTTKLKGNRSSGGSNRTSRKKTSIARKSLEYDVSVRAIQGARIHMEDDYFVGNGGKFVGVFDGHGGSNVSHFLATKLYKYLEEQVKRKKELDEITEDHNLSLSSLVSAIRAAFGTVESQVLRVPDMMYQGSTAVTVTIHEERDGSRTLLSANVGDSRAVLCRGGGALDLTRDHKPNDERERARIQAIGGEIEWDNIGKVHRVKNLSLSRAIGDSFAKPPVSSEVEIKLFRVQNDDEFMVLASDGLWDVMSSEEVVNFVTRKTNMLMKGSSGDVAKRIRNARRKNMSRYIANEAMKRGSGDNICVIIVWLKPLED